MGTQMATRMPVDPLARWPVTANGWSAVCMCRAMTAFDTARTGDQDEARRAIYEAFMDGLLSADEATARLLALDVRSHPARTRGRLVTLAGPTQAAA